MKQSNRIGLFFVAGMGVGTAVGMAAGNIWLGLIMGAVLGTALGVLWDFLTKRRAEE